MAFEVFIPADNAKFCNPATVQISNFCERIYEAVDLYLKITKLWLKGNINFKEKLRKLIFPEGLIYDKEKWGISNSKNKFCNR